MKEKMNRGTKFHWAVLVIANTAMLSLNVNAIVIKTVGHELPMAIGIAILNSAIIFLGTYNLTKN